MRYSQLTCAVTAVVFSVAVLTCGKGGSPDSTGVATTGRDARDAGAGQVRGDEPSSDAAAASPSESEMEGASEPAESPEPAETTEAVEKPEPVQESSTPSASELTEDGDAVDASVPESDLESEIEGESSEPDPVGSAQDASVVEVDCPPLESRTVVTVEGEIESDTVWTCDNVYRLSALTYVLAGVELTIQPGTQIVGDEAAGLVITRGGRIAAEGTADNPIVFTSSAPPGSRVAADWGGVVLLGAAPTNEFEGQGVVYGLDYAKGLGVYGGNEVAGSCGTLRYTRIEFAGGMIGLDMPLNGLLVGSCGHETQIDYLHVHRSGDDGVGMRGGNANLRHVLVTDAWDDGLHWREGWQGKAQYLVVHHGEADSFERGIEGVGNFDDADALPRSMPVIHNFTLVGSLSGIAFRRSTWGELRNGLVMTGSGVGVDIEDAATAMGTQQTPLVLTLEHSLFYDNLEDFASDSEVDDDGFFDDAAFFSDPALGNLVGVNPLLGAPSGTSALGIIPSASSPAATAGVAPPDDEFFDSAATYIGAVAPGGQDWTTGWTVFPSN